MNAKALKAGIKFQWESIDKDNLMVAVVGHHNPWNAGGRFFIYFNGVFFHTCKGYQSLETRLKKLIKRWGLEEVQYDEENAPL